LHILLIGNVKTSSSPIKRAHAGGLNSESKCYAYNILLAKQILTKH
jgi:hypothetical protein